MRAGGRADAEAQGKQHIATHHASALLPRMAQGVHMYVGINDITPAYVDVHMNSMTPQTG